MSTEPSRVDVRWSLPGRSGDACLADEDRARSFRAMVDREDAKNGQKRQWKQMACQHTKTTASATVAERGREGELR